MERRRFISLDQLETLRRAREADPTTQYLAQIIARHPNERLAQWLARQEQSNA